MEKVDSLVAERGDGGSDPFDAAWSWCCGADQLEPGGALPSEKGEQGADGRKQAPAATGTPPGCRCAAAIAART